jgi:hypothetical protein
MNDDDRRELEAVRQALAAPARVSDVQRLGTVPMTPELYTPDALRVRT